MDCPGDVLFAILSGDLRTKDGQVGRYLDSIVDETVRRVSVDVL
jgi:hypothetical protein